MAASLIWMLFGAAGLAAQLDLNCAAPDRARALIEYARLSEIEQAEDNHRDALDKALARCPAGAGREACRSDRRRQALLDWDRKVTEIKGRYEQMYKDFEEKCRASIASIPEAPTAQAVEKGPDARRRAKVAGEACPGHVEPAAEGANEADGPFSAACYSGFLISWASSPTTPRRKVSTQTMKISPWTIVTQAPS